MGIGEAKIFTFGAKFDLTKEMQHTRDVSLGDVRLNHRFSLMMQRASENPRASFPQMFPTSSELEGAYRFLSNDSFSLDQQLAPHLRETARKCGLLGEVLVVHDTTTFSYPGKAPIAGMGTIQSGVQGFFGHASLAIREGESRISEGLLAFSCFNRLVPAAEADVNEASRWLQGVRDSEAMLSSTRCIHVADSECDSYPFFVSATENKSRFVTRLHRNRQTDSGRLFDGVLQNAPFFLSRPVKMRRRPKPKKRPSKQNPPRPERSATLEIRAMPLVFHRPRDADKQLPHKLALHIVHVLEKSPPEGQQPIEWLLVTNLPIHDEQAVARVVDIYRSRWSIEEFFKALKTGCEYNKRQLESYIAFNHALGLLLPVAWQLLQLRNLARASPDHAAREYLRSSFVQAVQRFAPDPVPDNPTVAQVMFAVARTGGFIAANKTPGWLTLGRGMQELIVREQVWLQAKEFYSKDVIND
jgi:hypothetical protein